jgi:hypothetical protein
MKTLCALSLLFTILVGCVQSPPQPNYAQQVALIPPPTNEEERQQKCTALRSEIARQQNIAMMGSAQLQGMYAVAIQARARNNIAALESRASDFGCSAAFGERPVQSNIESCVSTCKANTSKTPEQCFDTCNH